MSSGCMRLHTISRAGRPSAATARMLSRSSSPIAGMPISSSGTPMATNWRAMLNFSLSENATPADCSPSRKVVSLMVTQDGDCMAGLLETKGDAARRRIESWISKSGARRKTI